MVALTSSRTVRQRRRYDASSRRAAAATARAAIVAAAERRFLDQGYAATTVAAVAADAGVSVDTVYKSFEGKAGLVRAICRKVLEDADTVAAERRTYELQMPEPDPRRIIDGWAALAAESGPRITPMLVLVRNAAATDPDLRALQAQLEADRLRRMVAGVERLSRNGHLRDGVTIEMAADIVLACNSPELWELLVLRRGWPPDQYERFVADTMQATLL